MRWLALLLVAFSASAADLARGTLVENVATSLDATQTYTLYLPRSYDPAKRHPLLLIFDPRGRGAATAEIFREGAEEFGWILISSDGTRSDTTWEPNNRALRALVPEVSRYAVDRRRMYATGFSGTAMAAWLLGMQTGSLAGVIGVGGRLVEDTPPAKFSFAHYGFAGDTDFNNRDMRAIDALLEREKKAHRFRSFAGEHRWMPSELARDAMAWMELIAMKEQRRPRDEALIEKLYERDLAAAKPLQGLAALRWHRAMLHTYEGLRAVGDLRASVARLEADPVVQRELKDEQKWDAFELKYMNETLERTPAIIAALREQDLPLVPALMREFRVADLQRRAKRDDAEGLTARRLLEALHGQMSFYLLRQFMERREYRFAVAVLTVATEIHPNRAYAWRQLAEVHDLMGNAKRAAEARERAKKLE